MVQRLERGYCLRPIASFRIRNGNSSRPSHHHAHHRLIHYSSTRGFYNATAEMCQKYLPKFELVQLPLLPLLFENFNLQLTNQLETGRAAVRVFRWAKRWNWTIPPNRMLPSAKWRKRSWMWRCRIINRWMHLFVSISNIYFPCSPTNSLVKSWKIAAFKCLN